MTQYRPDESTVMALGAIRERAEILDSQGKVIGYFEPVPRPEDELRKRAFENYDQERHRRLREAKGPTYTTAQVLEHLRSLGTKQ
jgi:hypothetical protein